MLFSDETKERFVTMLENRQIIVIRSRQKGRKTFAYKFIGANDSGKWDFTPLVASESNFPATKDLPIYETAVFANDAVAVICEALKTLKTDGLLEKWTDGIDYFKVRENLTFFYI